MVTAKSLVVSDGNKVIREEPMVDFHGQQAPPRPHQRRLHRLDYINVDYTDVDDAAAPTAARRAGAPQAKRRTIRPAVARTAPT